MNSQTMRQTCLLIQPALGQPFKQLTSAKSPKTCNSSLHNLFSTSVTCQSLRVCVCADGVCVYMHACFCDWHVRTARANIKRSPVSANERLKGVCLCCVQTISITNVKHADSQGSKAAQVRQKRSPQVEFPLLHHNGCELCVLSGHWLSANQWAEWREGPARMMDED